MLETLENKLEYIPSKDRVNAVYLLYQENTRRVYVGSSGQPGLRSTRHFTLLKKGVHYNPVFQELYNINPNFYRVYYTVKTRDDAYALEQALVDYYKPTGLLINTGFDVRAPNKGKIASSETRLKQSIAKTGFTHTTEAREKIRLAGLGRTKSIEERTHLSILKKGKAQPDHIAEMCRERNRLRSKAFSGDGITYESIREAARQLNTSRAVIKNRLQSVNPRWKDWFYV